MEAEQKARAEAEAKAKAEEETKPAVDKDIIDVGQLGELEEIVSADTTGFAVMAEAKKEQVQADGQAKAAEEVEKRIPRFDLAQQILTEQRRAASMRRKKPVEEGTVGNVIPATGTVGQIIREAKKGVADVSRSVQQLSPGAHGTIKGADNLSPAQQGIIAEVVTMEIAKLCDDERRREPAW